MVMKRRFFDIESIFFAVVHVFTALLTSYFHHVDYTQKSQLFFMAALKTDGEVREFLQEINFYWYFVTAAVIFSYLQFFCCFCYIYNYFNVEPFMMVIVAMFQSFCYTLIYKMLSIHHEKAEKLKKISPHAKRFDVNLVYVMIPLTIIFLAISIFTVLFYTLCVYIVCTKSKRIDKKK
ncbi:unnamed protein product [Caenorhabditis angaria]|uniref:Uncharacterized protein n=1 Tax=Caenorhabditis angaria TaxID=860376 RepID=A0A9P1INV4_9PELO|nr:unnamed protein product [Caenorhabditis angaria]